MSLFRLVHGRRMAPFLGVPGPEPTFPFGNLADFIPKRTRPWEVCAEYGRRHGSVCVFYLGGEPVLMLHDATLIEQVLETDRLSYYKDAPVAALMPVLTNSSPNINNGEDWARKRKANPLTQDYAKAWLAGLAGPMSRLLAARFAALAERSAVAPVALQEQVQRHIFDAFSLATVGRELGDQAYADFLAIATEGSRRMLSGMPFGKELGRKGRAARERWHGVFAACLEEARRDRSAGRIDLASVVVRMGTPLPDAAIHAELGNVFFGGDFSVPSCLVTAAWCLTQHPEQAARLRAELQALPDDPGAEAIEGCVQLDHVLRESMRFRSAVPILERRALPDRSAALGGLTLPPNTLIFISNWLLHADRVHWPDPDRFLPERWGNGVSEANPVGSGHFFPLGRGPRMCMGTDLAMFTMKVFLATLYRSYRVEAGRGQPYDDGQRYFFGVRMPWGIRARLQR
jgi:cytochrome P450